MARKPDTAIHSFGFEPGQRLAGKYEILSYLGSGWQGEVYRIREINTDIERAAKIFFPDRNVRNRTSITYARKLHKLRECPVLIQYHTQETIAVRGRPVTVLVSEYVEGELLRNYQKRFPKGRLPIFHGIHLLHALAVGIESIHHLGEYHGDLHAENIIVRRLGLSFDLKLLDLFHWGRASRANRNEDICNLIRVFYDAIGGRRAYHNHPREVREICCGLKRTLILKRFPTVSDLRVHLETQAWS